MSAFRNGVPVSEKPSKEPLSRLKLNLLSRGHLTGTLSGDTNLNLDEKASLAPSAAKSEINVIQSTGTLIVGETVDSTK